MKRRITIQHVNPKDLKPYGRYKATWSELEPVTFIKIEQTFPNGDALIAVMYKEEPRLAMAHQITKECKTQQR